MEFGSFDQDCYRKDSFADDAAIISPMMERVPYE